MLNTVRAQKKTWLYFQVLRHDQANDAPISPFYDEAETTVKSVMAAFGSDDPLFLMDEGKFRSVTCKL